MVAAPSLRTSLPGILAVGDVVDHTYHQATAAEPWPWMWRGTWPAAARPRSSREPPRSRPDRGLTVAQARPEDLLAGPCLGWCRPEG